MNNPMQGVSGLAWGLYLLGASLASTNLMKKASLRESIPAVSQRASLVGSTLRYEPDAVEADMERLIERLSLRGEEDAQEREEGWKESVRAYNAEHQEARRYQWVTYFRILARNHARLSEENERKAAALLEHPPCAR